MSDKDLVATQARPATGPMKSYTPPSIPDDRARPAATGAAATHKAANARRAAISVSNTAKSVHDHMVGAEWMSVKDICDAMSMARTTSARAVQQLLDADLITWQYARDGTNAKQYRAKGSAGRMKKQKLTKTDRITPADETAPNTEKHSPPPEASVDVFDLIHRSTEIIKRASQQLRDQQHLQSAPVLSHDHPDVVLAREVLPLLSEKHAEAVRRVINAATGTKQNEA